ncbi:MAG: hypothetical protein RBT65_06130 [Methanolobus sp.]|nr:hypothetical protein [Methanolobus sp.]
MKKITALFIISLLLYEVLTPAVAMPPPPGNNRFDQFFGRHRNMEQNSEIMDFISTYGLKDFQEVHINRTHTYVYLIPKENCSKKMVFLDPPSEEILWVRVIDMNETIPFEPAGPLDDFFDAHPEAEKNATIISFINSYDPREWKEIPRDLNRNSSVVYLIADKGDVFRELIFMEQKGDIRWVKTFNELQVAVNKQEALNIAAKKMNSSVSPVDVHIVFRDSQPFWVVTYITGPAATTYYIDTDGGEVYYYLMDAEAAESKESLYKTPGFGGMLTLLAFVASLRVRKTGEK